MTDFSENISDATETDLDWENRRVCGDDSCIGTIGKDGRCRVCGLLDPGIPEHSDLTASNSPVSADPDEFPAEDQDSGNQGPEWEDRKLCSDESCIGTIGPDGRCRVCKMSG